MGKRNRNRKGYYANSVDALIPELWAQESLAILEENMVIGNLVHRDFSNVVAKFGDTVHTRRPGEFTAKRKGVNDDVTIQNVTSTDVQVPLDQYFHVSFLIRDGEETLAMKDLITTYMQPAMLANARAMDRVLLGQHCHFIGNMTGKVGDFTGNSVKNYFIDSREKLNENKAYVDGRNFILGSHTESNALKPEFFTSAEKIGDNGSALRNASLGRVLGFNTFMSQNMSSVIGTFGTTAGAVNLAAGYAAGSTVLVVDGITGLWTVGSFVSIDGVPYHISAVSATLGNTTGITLASGLIRDVADNAVITRYTPGQINNGAGYAAGEFGYITVDTFSGGMPKVGQIVSLGITSLVKYTIIDVTSTTILLDRPLAAAVVDNDLVNIAPAGEYNFAFHRNALCMVNRPLAMPMAGSGAAAAVASYNGLSMRAVITYNGTKQGHLVTLDFLMGVAVLDTNLGVVMVA